MWSSLGFSKNHRDKFEAVYVIILDGAAEGESAERAEKHGTKDSSIQGTERYGESGREDGGARPMRW